MYHAQPHYSVVLYSNKGKQIEPVIKRPTKRYEIFKAHWLCMGELIKNDRFRLFLTRMVELSITWVCVESFNMKGHDQGFLWEQRHFFN